MQILCFILMFGDIFSIENLLKVHIYKIYKPNIKCWSKLSKIAGKE